MTLQNPTLVELLARDIPVVVLSGHYGVGKTNLALNLACACAQAGYTTTLADLDLVNPYFRSSDYDELLAGCGVELIEPTFARTALDTPSIDGRLEVALEYATENPTQTRLIIDLGGDDAGATALGRFSAQVGASGAQMLHVINAFRALTHDHNDAAAIMHEVEAACGMQAKGLVNVSHLAEQTTVAHITEGYSWATDAADVLGAPLIATCVPEALRNELAQSETASIRNLAFIERLVRTPWQD